MYILDKPLTIRLSQITVIWKVLKTSFHLNLKICFIAVHKTLVLNNVCYSDCTSASSYLVYVYVVYNRMPTAYTRLIICNISELQYTVSLTRTFVSGLLWLNRLLLNYEYDPR